MVEPPLCLWLFGYQGAGKTTLAHRLEAALSDRGRRAYVIDGDAFRAVHSPDLGFSREDRMTNIARMAHHAVERAMTGTDLIVAAMSPYQAARSDAARTLSPVTRFFEVHVSTPLDVCRARDTKGLYTAVSCGQIAGLNGVDEPFEQPQTPVLSVDMTSVNPDAAAAFVLSSAS